MTNRISLARSIPPAPAPAASVFITQVDDVSDLPLTSVPDGRIVFTTGDLSIGDGEGSAYVYVAASTDTLDGINVINGPSGVGRYLAIKRPVLKLAVGTLSGNAALVEAGAKIRGTVSNVGILLQPEFDAPQSGQLGEAVSIMWYNAGGERLANIGPHVGTHDHFSLYTKAAPSGTGDGGLEKRLDVGVGSVGSTEAEINWNAVSEFLVRGDNPQVGLGTGVPESELHVYSAIVGQPTVVIFESDEDGVQLHLTADVGFDAICIYKEGTNNRWSTFNDFSTGNDFRVFHYGTSTTPILIDGTTAVVSIIDTAFTGTVLFSDAVDIAVNATTGTKFGTATTQKIGFHNAAPVIQQAGTGEATGFVAGAGTSVNDDSTFTGNVGSTAYRINDIVKALKNLGLLAQ